MPTHLRAQEDSPSIHPCCGADLDAGLPKAKWKAWSAAWYNWRWWDPEEWPWWEVP